MIFARIVLIALCIVTAGLYMRVLLPPQPAGEDAQTEQAQATETTLEATPETTPAPAPEMAEAAPETSLKPLPADQMQLVLKALAPGLKTETH